MSHTYTHTEAHRPAERKVRCVEAAEAGAAAAPRLRATWTAQPARRRGREQPTSPTLPPPSSPPPSSKPLIPLLLAPESAAVQEYKIYMVQLEDFMISEVYQIDLT
jgi:hypothetical protein